MATLGALRSVGRKLDQLDTAKAASSGQSMAALVNQYVNLLQSVKRDSSGPSIVETLMGDPDAECERYRTALSCIASGKSDGSPDFNAPRYTAEEAQELAHRALYGNGDFGIEWVARGGAEVAGNAA